MTVKLFLPEYLFYSRNSCDLYGEIKIGEQNSISYYVISAINVIKSADIDEIWQYERDLTFTNELRHLGHVYHATEEIRLQNKDVAISFVYENDMPNIFLNKMNIKHEKGTNVNIFLYDERSILKLQDLNKNDRDYSENLEKSIPAFCADDDMHLLYHLLQTKEKFNLEFDDGDIYDDFKRFLCYLIKFPLNIFLSIFEILMSSSPFKLIFQYTVIHDYYREWLKYKKSGKRNYNIAFDIIIGLSVNALLLLYIENPGDYIIATSNAVVTNFRFLLHSLQGSPIGLKLNVQLNKFLLDCFGYHVELWATFLTIIEPCIRQLFVPIILLGFIGFSYQLALLTDIVSVMGLHAYCFSIYAAVLYKVEIKGLQALWKVMLGKRKNVLKNRVESHNYMNRQLYLATVFFTSLLFLFPTVLTYYIVFTTLRLCITLFNFALKSARRFILEFPLEMFLRWCVGDFYGTDSLQLEFVHHAPSRLLQLDNEIQMCVFRLVVHSTYLDQVFSCHSEDLPKLVTKERTSFKTVCQKILQGTV